MPLTVVAVSGSLHGPSKTAALLERILAALAARTEIDAELIELHLLAPELGSAVRRDQVGDGARAALESVEAADLLVVASPVYRASYTGLFKHLFDLVGQRALAAKPVLIAATGGSERHALVIEHQFRPLFGFFEASIARLGIYAKDADFTDYEVTSPELLAAINAAVDSALQLYELRNDVHLDS